MPIPYAVAHANRVVFNPLARRLAGKVPPVVLIEHRGRRSGRRFRTPVFGFFEEDNGTVVIVLTYGPDVDWLKNLRAAGGGRSSPAGAPTASGARRSTRASAGTRRFRCRFGRSSGCCR